MEADDSEQSHQPPPAILVVTCSSANFSKITDETAAAESKEAHVRDVEQDISTCLAQDVQPEALSSQAGLSPFPTVELNNEFELQQLASSETQIDGANSSAAAAATAPPRTETPKRFSLTRQRIRFCVRETPAMSRGEQVRFLRKFRFGDTYKLKNRSWLIPQFLSGALTLMGVVLFLVGIISLQINKYLHACDAEDGIDCKSNTAKINNVMMPIGVGTTGGGLSLILISGFVFVHAFCVIYEDADNEEDGIHDGVLHIPKTSARAALLGSNTALSPEDIARCQSYYDNLQGYAAN
uniref:Conserved plasma membrane protein n=1 Tax=Macrostomum lignano TaxID=282301 RepID=A0A1I8HM25_9PLAT